MKEVSAGVTAVSPGAARLDRHALSIGSGLRVAESEDQHQHLLSSQTIMSSGPEFATKSKFSFVLDTSICCPGNDHRADSSATQ